jgi:hypothetical protein
MKPGPDGQILIGHVHGKRMPEVGNQTSGSLLNVDRWCVMRPRQPRGEPRLPSDPIMAREEGVNDILRRNGLVLLDLEHPCKT